MKKTMKNRPGLTPDLERSRRATYETSPNDLDKGRIPDTGAYEPDSRPTNSESSEDSSLRVFGR